MKYYLVAFNIVSAAGWAYILYKLVQHLVGLSPTGQASSSPQSASALFSKIVSAIPPLPTWGSSQWQHAYPQTSKRHLSWLENQVPKIFAPYISRASTAYTAVGPATTLVQSLATLEVLHAALGWVRSPVGTTAAQVASRLISVWAIVERYPAARSSPFYASMVFAWAATEVIRYPFYALNLVGITPPYPLLWLRYSTFLVLYPIGAASEAFVNFATLPKSRPIPSLTSWAKGTTWSPEDILRGAMFILWWPGKLPRFYSDSSNYNTHL